MTRFLNRAEITLLDFWINRASRHPFVQKSFSKGYRFIQKRPVQFSLIVSSAAFSGFMSGLILNNITHFLR